MTAPAQIDFGIDQRISGHRATIAVTGEIDIATAPELSDAVEDALIAGVRELWIDLRPTTFIDSTGLHAVLTASRRMPGLTVLCPPGPVRRVFDLSGVSSLVTLQSDESGQLPDSRAAAC